MGSKNRVMVEIDLVTRLPIRIIKSNGGAIFLSQDQVAEWPRKEAVSEIRKQVFARANGLCDKCGRILGLSGHMHERIPKGNGGEVSVSNGWALCFDCHEGPNNGEHKRYPQWTNS